MKQSCTTTCRGRRHPRDEARHSDCGAVRPTRLPCTLFIRPCETRFRVTPADRGTRVCPPTGRSDKKTKKFEKRLILLHKNWLGRECLSDPSPPEFPANREFYREFCDFGAPC